MTVKKTGYGWTDLDPSIRIKIYLFHFDYKEEISQTIERSLKGRVVTRGGRNQSLRRKPLTLDRIPVLKVRGFLWALQFPQLHMVIVWLSLETQSFEALPAETMGRRASQSFIFWYRD